MPKAFENVGLSELGFQRLLSELDSDDARAGEKYLELCLKLRKLFAWKRCREASIDRLVDETLDRIARKLADGTVVENLNSYAHGVAQRVWLEFTRKPPEEPLDDDPPEIAIPETVEEADRRHECLDKCLAELNAEDRALILGYYDLEENEKNKDNRRNLASRFGKSSGALKVQATRLREKLKKCISECLKIESDVTK